MCGFFASNDPLVNQKPSGHQRATRISWSRFSIWFISHQAGSYITRDYPSSRLQTNSRSLFFDGGVIVFNGEILNIRELQRQYGLENSDSDTETLDALLSIKAFNLSELEGFFAFVKISASGEITHCARDKFGVKPLFLFKRDGFFSVSSEASVLSDIFSLPYCDQSILEYRAFRAPVFTGSYFRRS